MYLLQRRNAQRPASAPNLPIAGDVIVSSDFRRSYVVAKDGSHRRLSEGDHRAAVARVKQEAAAAEKRKQEAVAAQAAIDAQLERDWMARVDRMIEKETRRLNNRPLRMRAWGWLLNLKKRVVVGWDWVQRNTISVC